MVEGRRGRKVGILRLKGGRRIDTGWGWGELRVGYENMSQNGEALQSTKLGGYNVGSLVNRIFWPIKRRVIDEDEM